MTIVKKVNISHLSRTIYPTIIYAHHKNINVVSFHTIIQLQADCSGRSGGKVQFNIFIFIFCTAVAWLRRPCLGGGAARGRAQSSLLPRESLGSVQLRCPGPAAATQQPPSHGSTADTEIVPPPRPCHILTLRR